LRFRSFILLIAPVALFVGVLYYGIVWNLLTSLTNYSIYNPNPRFVGLATYSQMLSDADFINALRRTFLWAVILVLGGNALGLLIASSIFQFANSKIRTALTSYFVYPLALPLVASGVIWRWLFDSVKGVNTVLSSLGLPQISWLTGENAFWSMVLVSLWIYSGFIALLYLAAFYNVPQDLIDSALVDGADALTIMARIVIPHSKLGLVLGVIFSLLFALQMFDLPYSVLFLNPFTMTIVMYLYSKFAFMLISLSTAACIFLIAISAVIVIPYATYGIRKWILKVM